MDYFLRIYDINNWKDYITKSFQQQIDNNINVIIIACLFKLHPKDLLLTNESIHQIKRAFFQLKICDKNIKEQELIKLIGVYANKYINNPNEELLISKLK